MMDFQTQLKRIYKRMRATNQWFHFTRNNPRTTLYFYHWLINLTGGYCAWEKIDPAMKNAWESARWSFDQMYGLIKAWKTTLTEVPQKAVLKPAPEDMTQVKIDALRNEMRVLFETKEKLKAEKEMIEAEKALEKARNGFVDETKPDCPLQQYSKDAANIQITIQKKGE